MLARRPDWTVLVVAYQRFTFYYKAEWLLNKSETPPQVRSPQT